MKNLLTFIFLLAAPALFAQGNFEDFVIKKDNIPAVKPKGFEAEYKKIESRIKAHEQGLPTYEEEDQARKDAVVTVFYTCPSDEFFGMEHSFKAILTEGNKIYWASKSYSPKIWNCSPSKIKFNSGSERTTFLDQLFKKAVYNENGYFYSELYGSNNENPAKIKTVKKGLTQQYGTEDVTAPLYLNNRPINKLAASRNIESAAKLEGRVFRKDEVTALFDGAEVVGINVSGWGRTVVIVPLSVEE